MKRELSGLVDREFDLVVVGGGVYGAASAWDAALRGLRVALVEKDDFGAATSFNSLKTIHGGLRYLQHADLGRMRESIRERRILMRVAPHLVHPLPFLIPTYRDFLRSRPVMALALVLNDLVGFDRNRDADPAKRIPGSRLVSREECLRLFPGIEQKDLTGGALWYDCQMHNSDRLTLDFVLSAARAGARVANHLEVIGFLRDGDRVRGVRARDLLGGDELEIRGKIVLNAAGPWVDRLIHLLDGTTRSPLFHFSKAMNLITHSLSAPGTALGMASRKTHRDPHALVGKGWRFFSIIPWRGCSLIGTSHAPYDGEPDRLEATEKDIQEFLSEVNEAYPAAALRREDVRLVHRGLLPRVPATGGGEGVTLVKQYRIYEHRREGIEGLLTIVGVKYTTARDVARRAVDRVFSMLDKAAPACRTGETALAGGNIERFEEFLSREVRKQPYGLSEEVVRHLVYTYGSAYPDILRHLEEDPCLGQPVAEGSPVLRAEVLHAVREEMAEKLASVVLRRTELGSAGHPGRACVEACAAIMARELGWNEARAGAEIEEVERFYRKSS